MNMKISNTALMISLALMLGGCMVGPDYHRPQVPVPAHYKPLPGWTMAQPSAEKPKGDWWTAFNDPLIDQLEPLVSVSNQTVRADYANYQEALAEVRAARAGLFPTISATGSGTKARSSVGNAARVVNSAS